MSDQPIRTSNDLLIEDGSMDGNITSSGLDISETITYAAQAVWTDSALEIFTVTAVAFASTGQGDYLAFSEPTGGTFAAWFDKDNNGTAPTGAIYTAATNKIEVDIVTGDTAAQVATKLKAAIEANGAFDQYVITINSAILTFTANTLGSPTNAAPHNTGDTGAGSLVVSVTGGDATPVGTFDLQGSNDDTTYTSVLTAPSSISGASGSLMVNVERAGYAFIRVVYTRVSGDGTINVRVNTKRA